MSLSHALGLAAPLQIQVDGVDTNRTAFCVGENVTLTCTVAANRHRWKIPDSTMGNGLTLFTNDPEVSIPPFLFEFVNVVENGSAIITSVSYTVFPDLEGVSITCLDGLSEPQTYTGAVLGETSGGYMSCVHHLISRFASDI